MFVADTHIIDMLRYECVEDIDPSFDDYVWFAERISSLTDTLEIMSPSEWAEANRYIPPSVTSAPGFCDYSLFPYMREVVDCLDVRSPIREINIMKGVQLSFTTNVIENGIGYCMAVVKSAPVMLATSDESIAKIRMDQNITPMIQQSGLSSIVRSDDDLSKGKTGKTQQKITWDGGGYLLTFGSNSPGKFSSFSIRYSFQDEVDRWKDTIGKDGDPGALADARTNGYRWTRKIVRGSTPLLLGSSRIHRNYSRGDQRKFMVPCLSCGHSQELRFNVSENGKQTGGLIFEIDEDGILINDSVRYRCPKCGHDHNESDKSDMLIGGMWVATARPQSPDIRSYHISALYSPSIMFTWAACVQSYLNAWDVKENQPKSLASFQEFYNNILGVPFEMKTNRLHFETVSAHRRRYSSKTIPNKFAEEHAGGIIQILTGAIDVHAEHLDVAVMGWSPGRRCFVIDERTIKGDCTVLDGAPWRELREMIEATKYTDEIGRVYGTRLWLIDASYNTELVTAFCGEYRMGIVPVMGRTSATIGRRTFDEFSEFTTNTGTLGYLINTDPFKDRWSGALRRSWSGQGTMPEGMFSAPVDIDGSRLKQLTVEYRVERVDKKTGNRRGWEWHRPSGAANELWDLLIYASAALELIAWRRLVVAQEREAVDWDEFFQQAAAGLYYDDSRAKV